MNINKYKQKYVEALDDKLITVISNYATIVKMQNKKIILPNSIATIKYKIIYPNGYITKNYGGNKKMIYPNSIKYKINMFNKNETNNMSRRDFIKHGILNNIFFHNLSIYDDLRMLYRDHDYKRHNVFLLENTPNIHIHVYYREATKNLYFLKNTNNVRMVKMNICKHNQKSFLFRNVKQLYIYKHQKNTFHVINVQILTMYFKEVNDILPDIKSCIYLKKIKIYVKYEHEACGKCNLDAMYFKNIHTAIISTNCNTANVKHKFMLRNAHVLVLNGQSKYTTGKYIVGSMSKYFVKYKFVDTLITNEYTYYDTPYAKKLYKIYEMMIYLCFFDTASV